jgi:hypothetical protein
MLTATRRIRCSAVNNVRARCLTRGRPSLHESGRHAGLRRLSRDGRGHRPAGRVRGCSRARELAAAADHFRRPRWRRAGPAQPEPRQQRSQRRHQSTDPVDDELGQGGELVRPTAKSAHGRSGPDRSARPPRILATSASPGGSVRHSRGGSAPARSAESPDRGAGLVLTNRDRIRGQSGGGANTMIKIRVDGHGCGDDRLQRRTRAKLARAGDVPTEGGTVPGDASPANVRHGTRHPRQQAHD